MYFGEIHNIVCWLFPKNDIFNKHTVIFGLVVEGADITENILIIASAAYNAFQD